MKTSLWKTVFLSVSLLSTASVVYADNWKTEGLYQVKDGLVKDPKSGLMWMRCSVGQKWDGSQCQGAATLYSWEKAMDMPEKFDYASYKDWRVPSHNELKSLVYCTDGQINKLDKQHSQCGDDYAVPTIVQTAFPQTPDSWFWTSSPETDDWFCVFPYTLLGNFSWVVNFSNGLDVPSHRDDSGYLRLVRNGK
ncbi:DUF1566 domain-containing protein [Crenothrix sp.]|uniref:Lcl C-terminal domain-containing protein n=1 Tax=Crenothrix sp. TaxID=3100433 RepID=UPI00374DF641